MIDLKYRLALMKAFQDIHHCYSKHVGTVRVAESVQGNSWEGDVEVFELIGHTKAIKGYAWAFNKAMESEIVAFLELPPIDSPKAAVRIAMVGR